MTIPITYGQKMQAVAAHIGGAKEPVIAEILGVSTRTARRILSRQDIKDKIKYMESRMVDEAYEPAIDHLVNVVKGVKDIAKDTENKGLLQLRQMGHSVAMRIAEGTGLLPSNSMAPSITNIYNDHRQQLISPLVDRLVTGALEHKVSDKNTLDVVSSEEIEQE